MAKKSSVEKNNRRKRLTVSFAVKRQALSDLIKDKETPKDERFKAVLKLAKLPRNSSRVRIRNRCELSGRSRGYYRKFKLSRIELRNLASSGMIPGIIKASW